MKKVFWLGLIAGALPWSAQADTIYHPSCSFSTKTSISVPLFGSLGDFSKPGSSDSTSQEQVNQALAGKGYKFAATIENVDWSNICVEPFDGLNYRYDSKKQADGSVQVTITLLHETLKKEYCLSNSIVLDGTADQVASARDQKLSELQASGDYQKTPISTSTLTLNSSDMSGFVAPPRGSLSNDDYLKVYNQAWQDQWSAKYQDKILAAVKNLPDCKVGSAPASSDVAPAANASGE